MPKKNKKGEKSPLLYSDLADWFHLLTAPEDYREEADFYRDIILNNSRIPVKTMLELGSGGGNNASHLKAYFQMTLVDLSEAMLKVSQRLNPECEHIQDDMRNVRLGRQCDAVFIHDAISYLTIKNDLALAIETAFVHCKPGGVALFVPDYIREALLHLPATAGMMPATVACAIWNGYGTLTRRIPAISWIWFTS
jgi:trans-aconitate methyltransferase